MTDIDHADNARAYADVNQQADLAMPSYALAQVHATLALVAEQRTANLIAWLAIFIDLRPGETLTDEAQAAVDHLDREIRTRLLPEEVTS